MKLRRLFLFLPAIALLTTGSVKAQQPLFFGKDTRVAIQPKQLPWQAIGQLMTASKRKCSGTLVAPDIVLTAGHCFVGRHGELDAALTFTIGQEGDPSAQRARAVHVYIEQRLLKGLIRRPDGLVIPPSIASYDFAFVRLNKPIGKISGYLPVFNGPLSALNTALKQHHYTITQAGYPTDSNNTMMADKNCKATQLHQDGLLGHHCNTLPGDSGSPIFIYIDGKPIIIAVQSSAPDAKDRHLADNIAVTTPLLQKQLRHFIKNR